MIYTTQRQICNKTILNCLRLDWSVSVLKYLSDEQTYILADIKIAPKFKSSS